jgi:uncharacterized protein (TIGR02466 family)
MSFEYSQEHIFPARIGYSIDKNFDYKDDLIEWIMKYKENNPSVKVSNVGGWQSRGNFYQEEESFKPFMDKIWEQISTTVNNYAEDLELRHLITNNHVLKLMNIWVNVNTPGSLNHIHIHPGSLLSGVLWVQYPEKSGHFIFRDPNTMNNYCLGLNVHEVVPTEGTMAIFPAFVPHNVEPNESEGDRISISFNLDID